MKNSSVRLVHSNIKRWSACNFIFLRICQHATPYITGQYRNSAHLTSQPKVFIVESRIIRHLFTLITRGTLLINHVCSHFLTILFSPSPSRNSPRFPTASLSISPLINVPPLLPRSTNHLPKRPNSLISESTNLEILAWYRSLFVNPLPTVMQLALNASPQRHASQLSSITILTYLRALLM